MGWQGGVALALGSALVGNLGSLWRQRGAGAAADVDVRRPLRTVVSLFRSKWWTIGYVVAGVAWLLHVGALGVAPLSIVQASLAGGFVFLGVLADRFFGFELGVREWTGVLLSAAGLAFLALTAGEIHGSKAHYEVLGAVAFEVGMVAIGALLIVSARGRLGERGRTGVALGAAAGVLFTVAHVGIKALSGSLHGGMGLLGPWTPIVAAAGVAAFFASARSLQLGPAVPVIAVTSIAGNATSVAAGIAVFGDPVGSEPIVAMLRLVAFASLIVAAALIPGPLRAGRRQRARAAPAAGATG